MMNYVAIRAQGTREYWDAVALLAKLQGTSIAALVKRAVDTAYGEQLRLLDDLAANGVANQQQEPQAEVEHA
jgi:hypothetical protein